MQHAWLGNAQQEFHLIAMSNPTERDNGMRNRSSVRDYGKRRQNREKNLTWHNKF